jgi:hypothetical protein
MITNLLSILIFGSLTLLSFLLITNPLKVNKRANIWFGICTLIWSSFWIDEIVFLVSGDDIKLSFMLGTQFYSVSDPVVFYFSIRFFTNPDYTLAERHGLFDSSIVYLTLLVLDRLMVR